MELKAQPCQAAPRQHQPQNPFNGIERHSTLQSICEVGATKNPFNGIERERIRKYYTTQEHLETPNPFNGIERIYVDDDTHKLGIIKNPFNGIEREA